MEQIRGNYLLINGKTVEAEAGQSFASTVPFYEVIRVMAGKLLFFEDHYRRFQNSVSASCLELPAMEVLRKDLHRLIGLNGFSEGNIKILAYPGDMEVCITESYFIPHSYPDAAQYKTGVVTRSYRFTRPDPSLKQWFGDFRRDVSGFIKNEGIYEAILSDEQGHLTEGSRSNLFFTDEQDRIITAPAGTVLQGITKTRTEELCRQLKL
ncbi:MAG: aminotransferase class IV, partial [Bacteroidota bacterium]